MAAQLIGKRIEYGDFAKCSGDFVVTSTHWLLLRPDKTAFFRGDRAGREGRYFFEGNRLCVAFPKLRSWPTGRPEEANEEDVLCHSAFTDSDGIWYLKGDLFHGSLDNDDALAAIRVEAAR